MYFYGIGIIIISFVRRRLGRCRPGPSDGGCGGAAAIGNWGLQEQLRRMGVRDKRLQREIKESRESCGVEGKQVVDCSGGGGGQTDWGMRMISRKRGTGDDKE